MSHSLTPGARFGPLHVQSPLGEGGMGVVFRARDTRLGRDVAIKVLLPEVAGNPERLARFQREAQVLAALNHPNIAAIYGLEESGGVSALVMELVDGDDLSERIARGPLPLDDALRIAKQVADALEAAHEQGIVHRDLKPANIRVRPDGTVKVLDFGLAKAMEPPSGVSAASSRGASMSPTITSPAMMTGAGTILGTAAYMSPEQARGGQVDRRADLWAFGVILFEMLSGRRLFDGGTVSDTLASILKTDPDWSLLPPSTPAPIRRLLRRSLAKDRRERLDSAAGARLEIEEALAPPASEPATAGSASATRRLPWVVAAVAGAAALVLLAMSLTDRDSSSALDQPLVELEIAPPQGTTFGPVRSAFRTVAISPDGQQLAMIAGPRDGKPMLWIRPVASNSPRVIAGTENAVHPFWSPDGKWVGFLAGGKIKRVGLDGGQPQVVGDANRPGGTFNASGLTLLTRIGEPLMRASTAGGPASPLFALDAARKENGQTDPVFLPDGNHVIYFSVAPEMGVAFASMDGSVRKFLFPQQNSPADYAPDPESDGGWLLYNVRDSLMARRFNPATGDLAGEPVRLADEVVGGPSISVSNNGVLTFRRSVLGRLRRELAWFTRDGKQTGLLGDAGAGVPARPELSPDGATVAVSRLVDSATDIYLESVSGGPPTRFTFEPGADGFPVWSPDGQRLYYASSRDNRSHLIERPANGLGAERVLLRPEGRVVQPVSISGDGRWLVVRAGGAGQQSISFLSLVDGTNVRLSEEASVLNASMSPDGRWVAYDMTLGSGFDVFVRGMPREVNGSAVDAKRQISAGGGSQPLWSRDGKEIFYLTQDRTTVVSVAVETAGGVFRTGPPRALFKPGEDVTFDVSADGQRFLVNRTVSVTDPPVSVIVNWPKLLTR